MDRKPDRFGLEAADLRGDSKLSNKAYLLCNDWYKTSVTLPSHVKRSTLFDMKKVEQSPRRMGRPRSFDREAALEQAMLIFWRHGYESTSLTELTRGMGINAPSLYSAFGDKKQLFLEAVRRYVSAPVTFEQLIRNAPTARDAAKSLLFGAAVGFTGSKTPRGCLLATAAISCSPAAHDVQLALAKIRLQIERELLAKIEGDIASGTLPKNTASAALAAFCIAVLQGMSTLARDGASRAKLTATANTALQAWPCEAVAVRH